MTFSLKSGCDIRKRWFGWALGSLLAGVLWSCAARGQSADLDGALHDAAAAQGRGDDAVATGLYRGLLRAHPEAVERVEMVGSADGYLAAGELRFGMSQFDVARRDADAALRLNPKLGGLATLDGMIREQTADYDGAEEALLRAIAEDAKDYNAHFYLGANYYFKREMAKARAELTRAIELVPGAVQARYELALVERADGKLDEASKELEMVVEQMPDWMEPHVELSALYYKLHRWEDGAREREVVDRMMAALQERQAQAAH